MKNEKLVVLLLHSIRTLEKDKTSVEQQKQLNIYMLQHSGYTSPSTMQGMMPNVRAVEIKTQRWGVLSLCWKAWEIFFTTCLPCHCIDAVFLLIQLFSRRVMQCSSRFWWHHNYWFSKYNRPWAFFGQHDVILYPKCYTWSPVGLWLREGFFGAREQDQVRLSLSKVESKI